MGIGQDEGLALSGDQVLFTQTSGQSIRVRAMPIRGGKARTLFTHAAPAGLFPYGEQLVGSPGRVAMLVAYVDRSGRGDATQVFAGDPSGVWRTVVPFKTFDDVTVPTANVVQLAGDQVVTFERTGEGFGNYEVAIYDPARRVLPVPVGASFNGDFAVYSTRASEDSTAERVIVVNWRTGELLSIADFPDRIGDRRVATDGRAIVTVGQRLYEVHPGGIVRKLVDRAFAPEFAGTSILYFGNDGIRIIGANGAVQRFGVRTERLERFVSDGSNVLWSANGCLLVAPVADGPASAPEAGPCARAELAVRTHTINPQAPTIKLRLRCRTGSKLPRHTASASARRSGGTPGEPANSRRADSPRARQPAPKR